MIKKFRNSDRGKIHLISVNSNVHRSFCGITSHGLESFEACKHEDICKTCFSVLIGITLKSLRSVEVSDSVKTCKYVCIRCKQKAKSFRNNKRDNSNPWCGIDECDWNYQRVECPRIHMGRNDNQPFPASWCPYKLEILLLKCSSSHPSECGSF